MGLSTCMYLVILLQFCSPHWVSLQYSCTEHTQCGNVANIIDLVLFVLRLLLFFLFSSCIYFAMLPQSYGPIAGCITSPAALLSAYKTPNVLTETRLKNTNSVQFLYLFQPVPNVAQFSTTTGEDGPVFMLHHHPALLPKIGSGWAISVVSRFTLSPQDLKPVFGYNHPKLGSNSNWGLAMKSLQIISV